MATLIRRTLIRTSAPILSSFSRIVPQVASGELGVRQADPTQRAEQHVGERGEPQAQLIGPHGRRRGAVGEQIELAFLDPVLHLAARAVDPLVQPPGVDLRGLSEVTMKRGLASPPVHSALPMTRRDPAPAVQRRPAEVPEAAGRLAGSLGPARAAAISVRSRRSAADCAPGRRRSRRGWPRTMPSAPRGRSRCRRAAESAPAASGARIWLTMRAISSTDPPRHRCRRGAACRQQVPAAEDVERQIAVAVVVAVEEPAFLMPVQRIVGGIEIERDLRRGFGVGIEKQIDEQRLDGRGIGGNAGIARGSARLSSSRFSVLLPASGAQSLREAASLPASVASTGSWRSWSWSLRSS